VDLTEPAHDDRLVAVRHRADRPCGSPIATVSVAIVDSASCVFLILVAIYGVTTSTPAAAPTMNRPGPVLWSHEPNFGEPFVGSSVEAVRGAGVGEALARREALAITRVPFGFGQGRGE
jgi:hypothetical protein